jgi:hypothetical protein
MQGLPDDFIVPTTLEYDELDSLREWTDEQVAEKLALCESRFHALQSAMQAPGGDTSELRGLVVINTEVSRRVRAESDRRSRVAS